MLDLTSRYNLITEQRSQVSLCYCETNTSEVGLICFLCCERFLLLPEVIRESEPNQAYLSCSAALCSTASWMVEREGCSANLAEMFQPVLYLSSTVIIYQIGIVYCIKLNIECQQF